MREDALFGQAHTLAREILKPLTIKGPLLGAVTANSAPQVTVDPRRPVLGQSAYAKGNRGLADFCASSSTAPSRTKVTESFVTRSISAAHSERAFAGFLCECLKAAALPGWPSLDVRRM
jgi:hypothetical protein